MPESHGLVWGIGSSDLWALWIRFTQGRRGYWFCHPLCNLFAYIRNEFGLLPLFPLQPVLLSYQWVITARMLFYWFKILCEGSFLKGFGADSFKSLCLFVSVFCWFWTCCHWRGDQHMLVPGRQISPLSSPKSRGLELFSYQLRPQVDLEDRCWTGAKKPPKHPYCVCWADPYGRDICLWTVQKLQMWCWGVCGYWPAATGILLEGGCFCFSPCFLRTNGYHYLALRTAQLF